MIRPFIFTALICISKISDAVDEDGLGEAVNSLTDHLVGEINDRQTAIENEARARYQGNADTSRSANSYIDEKLNDYWEKSTKKFNRLDSKINKLHNKLNAAIAGVTAIASILYVAEDSLSVSVGVGNFRNGNAIAIGSQYKTPQNSISRVNISWDSNGERVSGAGYSLGW